MTWKRKNDWKTQRHSSCTAVALWWKIKEYRLKSTSSLTCMSVIVKLECCHVFCFSYFAVLPVFFWRVFPLPLVSDSTSCLPVFPAPVAICPALMCCTCVSLSPPPGWFSLSVSLLLCQFIFLPPSVPVFRCVFSSVNWPVSLFLISDKLFWFVFLTFSLPVDWLQ